MRAAYLILMWFAAASAQTNQCRFYFADQYDFAAVYHPDVFFPAHHDGPTNGLWRTTEPMFQALHDAYPNIITISKGYRQPTCFNTADNIQRRQGGSR